MIHAWPLWNAALEPGRRALAKAGDFLREHFGGAGHGDGAPRGLRS
jgi:hypothetical protein